MPCPVGLRRLLHPGVPTRRPRDDRRSGRHLRLGRPLRRLPRRHPPARPRPRPPPPRQRPRGDPLMTPDTSPAAPARLALPWWVTGDTNAFFGLGFNTLVN